MSLLGHSPLRLAGQLSRARGGSDPKFRWLWRGLSVAAYLPPAENTYRLVGVHGIVGATMAGATTSTRRTQQMAALDLTGSTTGAYATMADFTAGRCAASWTVAAVVWSDAEAASQGIFAKGRNLETAGNNHNFWLSYDQGTFNDDQAGNGWVVGFENAASAGANISAKYVVANGAGAHVLVGTLDTVADELRLYVDGIKGRTRSSVTQVAETNDSLLTIGRFAEDGDPINRWNGTIPAVWLWKDRAFTDGEAYAFMADPFAMFRPWEPAVSTAVAPPPSVGRSFCAGMIG